MYETLPNVQIVFCFNRVINLNIHRMAEAIVLTLEAEWMLGERISHALELIYNSAFVYPSSTGQPMHQYFILCT